METTPNFTAHKDEVKRAIKVAEEYNAKGYEKGLVSLRLSHNTTILVPREKLKDEAFIAQKREKYRIIAKNQTKTRIV